MFSKPMGKAVKSQHPGQAEHGRSRAEGGHVSLLRCQAVSTLASSCSAKHILSAPHVLSWQERPVLTAPGSRSLRTRKPAAQGERGQWGWLTCPGGAGRGEGHWAESTGKESSEEMRGWWQVYGLRLGLCDHRAGQKQTRLKACSSCEPTLGDPDLCKHLTTVCSLKHQFPPLNVKLCTATL